MLVPEKRSFLNAFNSINKERYAGRKVLCLNTAVISCAILLKSNMCCTVSKDSYSNSDRLQPARDGLITYIIAMASNLETLCSTGSGKSQTWEHGICCLFSCLMVRANGRKQRSDLIHKNKKYQQHSKTWTHGQVLSRS